MGSENKDKKQFLFGKFGKIVVRKTELSKPEDSVQESSLSAKSSAGVVIGTVSIAAGLYTDDVLAGATGVPY